MADNPTKMPNNLKARKPVSRSGNGAASQRPSTQRHMSKKWTKTSVILKHKKKKNLQNCAEKADSRNYLKEVPFPAH